MKKCLILLACLFSLFSVNLFGFTVKFDVAARGNIAMMTSLDSTTDDLFALGGGGRLYLDNIFVLDDGAVYGHAVGAIFGYGILHQQLKTGLYIPNMTEEEMSSSGFEAQDSSPSVPMTALNLGLMYRLLPVYNVSIGVGMVMNFVMNNGDYMYTDTNELEGKFIEPTFGSVVPEAIVEVAITRFFGNFGLDFGIHGSMLLNMGDKTTAPAFLLGGGASFGVRYRFSPY